MSIYYLTIYNFAICLQRYNISGKQTRKIILKDTKKSKLKKVFDKKKKRGDSFFPATRWLFAENYLSLQTKHVLSIIT
jgi:hypothetical protein